MRNEIIKLSIGSNWLQRFYVHDCTFASSCKTESLEIRDELAKLHIFNVKLLFMLVFVKHC